MTIKEHFGTVGNNTLPGTYQTTDVFFGSLGNDTYIVQDIDDSIQELAGMGVDTVKSSINYQLGANLENLRSAAAPGWALAMNSTMRSRATRCSATSCLVLLATTC